MDVTLLTRGLVIGFAIAAPVGDIGVLCIRRTLADGRVAGLVSGLGAATADLCYGAVAAFGLTAVQTFLVGQQTWLRSIGGLFLLYLGVRTFLSLPAPPSQPGRLRGGHAAAYLSTFGLTLTNPATIISFVIVFAGLRVADATGGYLGAAVLTAGVFAGSAAWWILLSSIVGLFRERFTGAWLLWINRLAGAVIFAFGVTALASL